MKGFYMTFEHTITEQSCKTKLLIRDRGDDSVGFETIEYETQS